MAAPRASLRAVLGAVRRSLIASTNADQLHSRRLTVAGLPSRAIRTLAPAFYLTRILGFPRFSSEVYTVRFPGSIPGAESLVARECLLLPRSSCFMLSDSEHFRTEMITTSRESGPCRFSSILNIVLVRQGVRKLLIGYDSRLGVDGLRMNSGLV